MMQRAKFILLTIIAIFTASCATRVEMVEKIDLSNGGALRLNVQSSSALSKVSDVPTPSAEEFLITIASTTADENGEYPVILEKQYGEMSLSTVLKEGDYSVTATSGMHEIFSTTTPTFSATANVKIEIGQISNVSLTATISSYLVDIVYTEEFKKAFTDYYVEAHVMDDRYTFAAMGDQCAYLAPGSVKVVLKGTTVAGQTYSSVIKEISSVGRERYVLTLAIRPQGQPFDVLVDTQVEQLEVSGELDPDLYPDMPEITVGSMNFTETVLTSAGDPKSMISFGAIANISDVEFTFTSDNVAYLGLEKDRTYHLNNVDDITALNTAGMSIDQGAIIGKRTAALDMSSFSTRLLSFNNTPTTYTATIKVSGVLEEVAQKDLTFTITPPSISLDEVTAGNSWSKSADVPSGINATVGSSDFINSSSLLKYQLSTDQGNWSTIEPTSSITGLTPNTTYYLRAVYRDQIYSQTRSFTTESTSQVVNAGMENWQLIYFTEGTEAIGYGSGIACYYPWNGGESEWWSTSNCRTVRYTILKSQTNNTPGVMWTTSAHSGSRAAEIRSAWAEISSSKAVSGKLLIGIMTSRAPSSYIGGDFNPEYINEGRPFASRPTKVGFWYKYAPFNGSEKHVVTIRVRSGNEVIGEARITDGASVSSYTYREIPINYTMTDKSATSLYICFASSENEEPPVSWQNVSFPDCYSSGWKGYKGSILNVDDVELIYEK